MGPVRIKSVAVCHSKSHPPRIRWRHCRFGRRPKIQPTISCKRGSHRQRFRWGQSELIRPQSPIPNCISRDSDGGAADFAGNYKNERPPSRRGRKNGRASLNTRFRLQNSPLVAARSNASLPRPRDSGGIRPSKTGFSNS